MVKGVHALITCCDRRSVRVRLHDGKSYRVPRTSHTYRPAHFKDSLEICRHQLPLTINFASTVHRVQGDTLDAVLFDLRAPIFAHGQLYTAITRARSRAGMFILVPQEDFITAETPSDSEFVVTNIVFRSILKYALPSHSSDCV